MEDQTGSSWWGTNIIQPIVDGVCMNMWDGQTFGGVQTYVTYIWQGTNITDTQLYIYI